MPNVACGIVGLPNVGKSTLFNAITRNQVPSENYPFCTIDPNVGVVEVHDYRLDELTKLSKSRQTVYATVAFVDIAGLVKGASKGEGLGNQFLSNIRETDAIIHVVRAFEEEGVIHVEGSIDPIRDIDIINLELILADLQLVENVLAKTEKQAKSSKEFLPLLNTLNKAKAHLNNNNPIRTLALYDEERELLKSYPFITAKKVLYVANVSEKELFTGNKYVDAIKEFALREGSEVVTICAKLEEEVAQLSKEEALEFLKSLNLAESGLDKLIKAAFKLLGLITYLTTGELETKAWTIKKGTTASEAAGKIHSDLEKGFIRAEVVSYNDMITYKGRVGAREAGKARSEGRDYIVQDGDVILFFHN